MACSHDKSKWAIPSGVVVFMAVLNSIAFSFISMVILGLSNCIGLSETLVCSL
jgi:hypothetical protein